MKNPLIAGRSKSLLGSVICKEMRKKIFLVPSNDKGNNYIWQWATQQHDENLLVAGGICCLWQSTKYLLTLSSLVPLSTQKLVNWLKSNLCRDQCTLLCQQFFDSGESQNWLSKQLTPADNSGLILLNLYWSFFFLFTLLLINLPVFSELLQCTLGEQKLILIAFEAPIKKWSGW